MTGWVFLACFLTTLGSGYCDHAGSCPSGYDRNQYLDITHNYLLCWKVDWSDETITFTTKVATTGWVGLGFSPTGQMPKSDVVIGWVNATDGQGYLKDRFATARAMPPIDDIQNVELLSSGEANGVTTLEFKRKLKACEPKDRSIEEGTTFVIYSYNANDPASEDSIEQHQVAGRASINLLSGTGNLEPAPLESDHKTVDILAPSVKLPSDPTTYWCTPQMLPQLQNEAHVIRVEPVIQANHEGIVHHIVLYACNNDVAPYINSTESFACDFPNRSKNIPDEIRRCRGRHVFTAWAVGGRGFSFPSQVGLPLSGTSGIQYVLMETHYNNENRRSDYVDSSGLRLFYTPTKRQYDGAVLEIGHYVSLFGWELLLPPKLDDIVLENICPATCTRKGLPTGGINVFGSTLHTHTVGKGLAVQHIRNGVQLPDIDRNDNYDFNFQDVVLLRNEVKVLPGDEIQVICEYDTSSRSDVTVGGEGTLDEMCLAFLLVYPRPNLSTCLSERLFKQLEAYLTEAFKKGWYVDDVDQNADGLTQAYQLLASVKGMSFPTQDAYDLWNNTYWSTKLREYECTDRDGADLVRGADDDVAPNTTLTIITKPLTKPTEASGPCGDSAVEFVCYSKWIIIGSLLAYAVTR